MVFVTARAVASPWKVTVLDASTTQPSLVAVIVAVPAVPVDQIWTAVAESATWVAILRYLDPLDVLGRCPAV